MTTTDEDQGFLTDDDTFAKADAKRSTPKDELAALLTKKIEKAPITLAVPSRPGLFVRFNTNIEMELLQAWQRRCTRKVRNEEVLDSLRLASILIANQAECLLVGDEDVYTDDDKPMNFRGVELAQMLGTDSTSTLGVVRALYGFDGHILTTMNDVLVAAGYNPDVDLGGDEDPIRRS